MKGCKSLLSKALRSIRKLNRFRTLIVTLSAIVVFIVSYLLVLPALTLDKKEADGLNIVFENRVIHTGKTVCIDELFGIEIAETPQLSEIEYTEKDYISIQLGSATLKKEEIAGLHQGSYITLKQRAGDPSLIIRAGKVIGTGEICVADDTFAIRVIEVK